MQRSVHCVDLGESFPRSIYLQKLASIQPRTSPSKFGGKNSIQYSLHSLPAHPSCSHFSYRHRVFHFNQEPGLSLLRCARLHWLRVAEKMVGRPQKWPNLEIATQPTLQRAVRTSASLAVAPCSLAIPFCTVSVRINCERVLRSLFLSHSQSALPSRKTYFIFANVSFWTVLPWRMTH